MQLGGDDGTRTKVHQRERKPSASEVSKSAVTANAHKENHLIDWASNRLCQGKQTVEADGQIYVQ